ncbi:MAG: folate-binding protein [Sphingomonas bacterium]|nr:folate-binding protein [Sphingomonas bacterium]
MVSTTLTDRAVVRMAGEDVRLFMQGLVTSDVSGALPVWAGLRSAQGKCLFDFVVWGTLEGGGDDLLLDCETSAADELIKRLSMYRLRRAITIARDEGLSVHWNVEADGVPDPRLAALGRRWIAPPSDLASGWLEHRLRLGVCEGRAELGDLLWLECNADELHGVSFAKGCFVGQENTARMNWRGKVNRRLFVVPIGIAPPARVRIAYPELGLAVAHLRIDEVPPEAILPQWIKSDA